MKIAVRVLMVSVACLAVLNSPAAFGKQAKTKTSKSKSTASDVLPVCAPEGYGPFNCGSVNGIACGTGSTFCGKAKAGYATFCDTSVPKPSSSDYLRAGICKTSQISAKGKKSTPTGLQRHDFDVKGAKKSQTVECYDLSADRVTLTRDISIAFSGKEQVDTCNAGKGPDNNRACNIIDAAITPALDALCGTKGAVPQGFTVYSRSYQYTANKKYAADNNDTVTVTAICSVCDSKAIAGTIRKQNGFFKKVNSIRVTGCGGNGC